MRRKEIWTSWFMIPPLAWALIHGGQFSTFEWSPSKDSKAHLVEEAKELEVWCPRDLQARAHWEDLAVSPFIPKQVLLFSYLLTRPLRLPVCASSSHLPEEVEAWGYEECAPPTGPRHSASKPQRLSSRRWSYRHPTRSAWGSWLKEETRRPRAPLCPVASSSSQGKQPWFTGTLFKTSLAPELREDSERKLAGTLVRILL